MDAEFYLPCVGVLEYEKSYYLRPCKVLSHILADKGNNFFVKTIVVIQKSSLCQIYDYRERGTSLSSITAPGTSMPSLSAIVMSASSGIQYSRGISFGSRITSTGLL